MAVNIYKDHSPLVTAIIVCYGYTDALLEAIDSVICQTQDSIELIISDDGSGKFSQKELEEYIENKRLDNIVSVVVHAYEENVGTVRNINRAIKEARGEYIKLIGGDDAFFDDCVFSDQVRFLQENQKYSLVTGLSEQCDEKLQHVNDQRVEETNKALLSVFSMPPQEAFIYYQRKGYSPFVTQATCFRRAFFDQYGYFDEDFQLMEDAPLGARLILEGIPVGVLEKYAVKHRMNTGVSATDDFFSTRKIRYYEDRITYCQKYIVPNVSLLGKNRVRMDCGISEFRLEMAIAKKSNASRIAKAWIVIKHFYPILLYMMIRSEKAKKAIRRIMLIG